eukprot:Opistho-2@90387
MQHRPDARGVRPASLSPFQGRVLRISLTPSQSLLGASYVLSAVLVWRCLATSADLLALSMLTVCAWYLYAENCPYHAHQRSHAELLDPAAAHDGHDVHARRTYPASCLKDRRASSLSPHSRQQGTAGHPTCKRVRFDDGAPLTAQSHSRGAAGFAQDSGNSSPSNCQRNAAAVGSAVVGCCDVGAESVDAQRERERMSGDGCDRPQAVRELLVAEMSEAVHPTLGALLDAVVPRDGLIGWHYERSTGEFALSLARPMVGHVSGVGPMGLRLSRVLALHVSSAVRGRVTMGGHCVDFEDSCLGVKMAWLPEIGVGRVTVEERDGALHLRHMGWSLSDEQIRDTVRNVVWG